MTNGHQYIKFVDSQTSPTLSKPTEENVIYLTKLRETYLENIFRAFSIKYCIQGNMHFKFNKHNLDLRPRHFIVATKKEEGIGYSYENNVSHSLCIDIKTSLINEANSILFSQGEIDLEKNLSEIYNELAFHTLAFSAADSKIGLKLIYLSQLQPGLVNGQYINEEFFFGLAEDIILHLNHNRRAKSNLHCLKPSTKQEILERLIIARNYISEHFHENPTIHDVTQVCFLSQFHFFRSFKQAFGITPHQFILFKKLEFVRARLRHADANLTLIAKEAGFSDIFTFSKAFKKHFKVSPSSYRKNIPASVPVLL